MNRTALEAGLSGLPARYELECSLGAGGGGEVWQVRDRATQASLALKLLSPLAGQREMDALVREGVTLSGLEGLGLPRIVRFGRLAGSERAYVLRELVQGDSLEIVLRQSTERALLALAAAAEQLTVLHRSGLLHGDVKPANIIVRTEGGATLVDLGLATPWREEGTQVEGLTPRYAAPELLSGKPITVRAELYALGLILKDTLEAAQVGWCDVATASELSRIAARGAAFDPATRFPSADEFAVALRSALGKPSHGRALAAAWPILGIDTLATALAADCALLPKDGILYVTGPIGSGRTTLLRRLAWSLGVGGATVGYIDDAASRAPEVALAELAELEQVAHSYCLIDDYEGCLGPVTERLALLRTHGARVIAVVEEAPRDARWFPVPPLPGAIASDLVTRSIPSLAGAALSRLLELSRCRPGRLRALLARAESRALSSATDVEDLAAELEGVDDSAKLSGLEGVTQLLKRGCYRDASRVLAQLDGQTRASFGGLVAQARLDQGTGASKQARAVLVELEASGALSQPGDEARWARLTLGRAELSQGDALQAAVRLEELGVGEDSLALEAAAQAALARAYLGESAQAQSRLLSLESSAKLKGFERVVALIWVARGLIHQREEQLDAARDAYRTALEFGGRAGDAGLLATARLNLAGLLKMRGDLAGALEHFEGALDLGERAGRLATVRNARINLANLDLYLGRLARVTAQLTALASEQEELSPLQCAQLIGLQAEQASRLGEFARASRDYARCAESYAALGRVSEAAEARLEGLLLETRSSQANVPALRLSLDRTREELGDSTAHRALCLMVEAALEYLAGDEQSARNALTAAIAHARETAQKSWVWRAHEARAELEERVGRVMRAQRDREEALLALEEIAGELPRDLREVFWDDTRRAKLREHISRRDIAHAPMEVMSTPRSELNADVSTLLSTPLEQRLARILEINAELVGEVNLERLMQRIIEHALRIVRAERGLVLLVDKDQGLRVTSSASYDASDPGLHFSKTTAETVVASGQPVVSINAKQDERMAGWASVHQLLLESVACVPIRSSRGMPVLGALYVETRLRRGNEFQTELPMLQAFADQAGIALHNAQLVLENQRRAQELEVSNQALQEAQERLREALANRTAVLQRTRQRLRETRDTLYGHFGFQGLVGTSAAMRRVYSVIQRVSDAGVPVLITGESGTGKEVVARAIHQTSSRARGPFIGVNCGAIPEHLLESELFGCVRGAFTGADRDRRGLFRESQGGTILLDEIGEMPAKMQAGLLRVIQERCVRPVGGTREEPVDVRLVFATHRDLAALVSQGSFREDLFYRINVVELAMPSLRERSEDIPQLVDHFLKLFAARYHQEKKTVSREAMAMLMAQPWRGNVRELENILLNAWVLSDDDDLCPQDFAWRSTSGPTGSEAPPVSPRPSERPVSAAPGSQTEERARIVEALARCGQNRAQAAVLLGIPRRTFYRRLEEYGLK